MTTLQEQAHSAAKTLLKEGMYQCWGRAFFQFDGQQWQPLSNATLIPLVKAVLARNGDFNNPKLPRLVEMTAAEFRRLVPWAPIEWGRAYEERKKGR